MRQPKPWYRTSKSAWFVQVGGKKHSLAKGPKDETRKAAFDAFYKLMASQGAIPHSDKLPVALICDHFLDHSQQTHSAETYGLYKLYLDQFCGAYGRDLASTIKPIHVTRWLDQHPRWKASRRHAALAVKRVFGWADKQGLLSPNPLRHLEVEPNNRRTRVLSAAEQAEILAMIKDEAFRQFVIAMMQTGCRPGEVARLTAENVNLELGLWVFDQHKTSKKTKKPRIVYLTPAMLELTRKLVARYPDGPLFRSPRSGKRFTPNGIRCRFRRLRLKLPHLKHFVAYSTRHTYATHAVMNGVGVAQVAELMGHSDVQMVARVYGHLTDQVQHMRAAAMKATSVA